MNSIIILFMEKKSRCSYKKLVRLMGLLCIGAANRDIFVLSDHFSCESSSLEAKTFW